MHFNCKYCIINPQIIQPSCVINECAYVIFNKYNIIESRGFIIENLLSKSDKIKLCEKTGISDDLKGARGINLSYCASILADILRSKFDKVIVVNYNSFYRALNNEYHIKRDVYIKKLIDYLNSINIVDLDYTEIENPVLIAVTDCINVTKKIIGQA